MLFWSCHAHSNIRVVTMSTFFYILFCFQGFICPNCMVNLSSPEQLHSHWEAVHNVSNTEPVVAAVSETQTQAAPSPNATSSHHRPSQVGGDIIALLYAVTLGNASVLCNIDGH